MDIHSSASRTDIELLSLIHITLWDSLTIIWSNISFQGNYFLMPKETMMLIHWDLCPTLLQIRLKGLPTRVKFYYAYKYSLLYWKFKANWISLNCSQKVILFKRILLIRFTREKRLGIQDFCTKRGLKAAECYETQKWSDQLWGLNWLVVWYWDVLYEHNSIKYSDR